MSNFLQNLFSEERHVSHSTVEKMRDEMNRELKKVNDKMLMMEFKLSDAEIDVKASEKKIELLENALRKEGLLEKSATENFGLTEDELATLSAYGCIGHATGNDRSPSYGGKKNVDWWSFELLSKAFENGLKDFTLKVNSNLPSWTMFNLSLGLMSDTGTHALIISVN